MIGKKQDMADETETEAERREIIEEYDGEMAKTVVRYLFPQRDWWKETEKITIWDDKAIEINEKGEPDAFLDTADLTLEEYLERMKIEAFKNEGKILED